MSEKKQIQFRRIRGRIVPIRVSDKAMKPHKPNPTPPTITNKRIEESRKGLAFLGAGVGSTILGAEVASRLVKKSASMRFSAKVRFNQATRAIRGMTKAAGGQLGLNMGINATYARNIAAAVKLRGASAGVFKARNLALGLGALGGAYLFNKGLNKLNKAAGDKGDHTIENAVITTGATALAAGFYYARLGTIGQHGLKGFYKSAAAKVKGAHPPHQTNIKAAYKSLHKGTSGSRLKGWTNF